MFRGGRRKRVERDHNTIASQTSRLLDELERSEFDAHRRYIEHVNELRRLEQRDLLDLEDRRRWHPEGPDAAARAISRTYQRIIRVPSLLQNRTMRVIGQVGAIPHHTARFIYPQRVVVCARRKIRKEVLHALKKTMKRGRGGGKRRRHDWKSTVSCK